MVAPILTPGAVIGISTLLFWNQFGGAGSGLHLSVLGQVSYIAAFVMLLVLARLQSFDQGLEEAALDLGASHAQVMRRILLPHLYPAIGAGAAIAFFQSIENFNVTLFTRGTYDTLTVYVFSKVRTGITPTINALAFLLILVTLGLRSGTRSPVAAAPASKPRARPKPAAPRTRNWRKDEKARRKPPGLFIAGWADCPPHVRIGNLPILPMAQKNACNPVIARPRISACTSCVPS